MARPLLELLHFTSLPRALDHGVLWRILYPRTKDLNRTVISFMKEPSSEATMYIGFLPDFSLSTRFFPLHSMQEVYLGIVTLEV